MFQFCARSDRIESGGLLYNMVVKHTGHENYSRFFINLTEFDTATVIYFIHGVYQHADIMYSRDLVVIFWYCVVW